MRGRKSRRKASGFAYFKNLRPTPTVGGDEIDFNTNRDLSSKGLGGGKDRLRGLWVKKLSIKKDAIRPKSEFDLSRERSIGKSPEIRGKREGNRERKKFWAP